MHPSRFHLLLLFVFFLRCSTRVYPSLHPTNLYNITTMLYPTSSFNEMPGDRLGCTRRHISGSERFSNASSAAFQPFHVFSMTKSPQGGLPYSISILWMGWGGFYLNTIVYKSKEYVCRSKHTPIRNTHTSYLSLLVYRPPHYLGQKCVMSLKILPKWCLVGALDWWTWKGIPLSRSLC